MNKILIIFFCFFIANSSAHAITSDWKTNEVSGAQTRVLGSSLIENDVRKILLGVEFKLKEGWKIYGEKSEDIGLPPSFDFTGSSNYKQHQILWPIAHQGEEKIADQTYKFNYYSDKVIIPLEVELKDQKLAADLKIKIHYGICKEVCVPVDQEFTLLVDPTPDCEAVKEIRNYQLLNPGTNEQEFAKIDMSLPKSDQDSDNPKSLMLMMLIAVLGGAILNIMPCVLPVLSIKLLSVINHSRAKTSKIRLSFLATIVGILSSFVALAIITYLLKGVGGSLGWGFQFQNPYFLVALILILTFFIADLIGFFEINFNQFLANLLNKKIDKSRQNNSVFIPNYLSGILAVMLATPCSAPFLGSAISFALTQSLGIILLIFVAIGFGFALPYFILIISPKLLRFLPKPGIWMVKVKQLMAGFLVATIIWLICILMAIIGFLPSILVSLLALGLFAAMKIKNHLPRFGLILVIIFLALIAPFKLRESQIVREANYSKNWKPFDEQILLRLVSENKVVLVDITADWCITCKFNKIRVLQSKELVDLLESGEVIGLRSDITKPDESVMNFLKKHNRFAIPFNAVYGPNMLYGTTTSELLNKTELLELIAKAKSDQN